MNNNQSYPFQRNRYYAGKLLTSADFQAEQDYFNNKERFMNSLLYGSGVLCGLGVVNLDDSSILIESGVAIDGHGREIVLGSAVVKKLSAIEGYDELESEDISLCISYKDEQVHSVYAVNNGQSDKEYEYSRIEEGVRLFLVDRSNVIKRLDMETEFFTTNTLFENEDYRLDIFLPAVVSKRNDTRISAKLVKKSDRKCSFTLHCVLQLPGFVTSDNGQEIEIDFESVALEKEKSLVKEYWAHVTDTDLKSTLVILKSQSAHAYINDEAVNVPSLFEMEVLISDLNPREIVNREIGRQSLEFRNLGGFDEYIRIADIHIQKAVNTYIIDYVEDSELKNYIAAPAQQLMRADYMDYFYRNAEVLNDNNKIVIPQSLGYANSAAIDHSKIPEIATGTLEIPLGGNSKKGDIKYSGEIIHGLGKGNVYIQTGFELISTDESLGANAKSTIYGNAELFERESTKVPKVELAVKVLNDKGSFVVAAKLLENVDFLVLTYRWVAIKFSSGNDTEIQETAFADMSIVPETPTVVLETKESHFFGVRFENMDSCSIVYELTEDGSGEITSDGVYTAPNKEGVYEIRIYCADMPIICAYAYAIVKRKTGEYELPV